MRAYMFILAVPLWLTGCAMLPDSVNYTASRDRQTGEWVDYFGASWNVPKPAKKP